ncbi:leucine-rich repeat transmembrane protein kinase protein, partial [Tanacetum coccineum]
RFEDDMYDRIWYPLSSIAETTIINSDLVSAGLSDEEKVPLTVMSNAIKSISPIIYSLRISWNGDTSDNLIIYIHLAEVEVLKRNQTREFNIYLNDNYLFGPISPKTSITTLTNKSPYTGLSRNVIKIKQTKNSNVPPICNAFEIYTVKQLQQYQTEDQDAAAIWNTKSAYGLKRNWQGDPCVPRKFLWEGLNCDYNDLNSTKIISLNLSSSGLSGKIVTALANLSMIESLNLTGNNFTRPLPAELLAKSKKGSLFLSGDQDKGYCLNGSCKDTKHTIMLLTSDSSNCHTHHAIDRVDLEQCFVIMVGDNQVAVKILSESSSQGYKEFQAELAK